MSRENWMNCTPKIIENPVERLGQHMGFHALRRQEWGPKKKRSLGGKPNPTRRKQEITGGSINQQALILFDLERYLQPQKERI